MILEALGTAYVAEGRHNEGLPLLENALDIHRRLRGGAGQSVRWSSLSSAYLLAGRIATATEAAPHPFKLAERYGERGHRAYALHALGCVMIASESLETARQAYADAIGLSQDLQMRPVSARSQLGLAIATDRLGRHTCADTLYALASQEYAEMGMVF